MGSFISTRGCHCRVGQLPVSTQDLCHRGGVTVLNPGAGLLIGLYSEREPGTKADPHI